MNIPVVSSSSPSLEQSPSRQTSSFDLGDHLSSPSRQLVQSVEPENNVALPSRVDSVGSMSTKSVHGIKMESGDEARILQQLQDLGMVEVDKVRHRTDTWRSAKQELAKLEKKHRRIMKRGRRGMKNLKKWAAEDVRMEAERNLNRLHRSHQKSINEIQEKVKKWERRMLRAIRRQQRSADGPVLARTASIFP